MLYAVVLMGRLIVVDAVPALLVAAVRATVA